MEIWQVVARESIRDLVARYNANGDTGRFDRVIELFAPDAVMELPGRDPERYEGHDEIRTIFTGTSERLSAASTIPRYLRHCTSTHQIDLVDEDHAVGRCYYFVIMAHGLDHWGRYTDRYERRDGAWKFVHRKVTTDGRVSESPFS